MDNSQNSNMPSLWVFLVIVLAVLLGVVLGTSFIMHMIQRRQRHQLERSIARGEVDLEILGIKRLNVPPEVIEKMPQYTFKSVAVDNTSSDDTVNANKAAARDFFQPTCSICLDDFVLNETQVRELPCRHIFHPECIDPFLRENSSLCPLCKRSALPAGVCPVTVTNVMVRRWRITRRGGTLPRSPGYVPPGELSSWQRRMERIRGPAFVAPPESVRLRYAGLRHGIPEEMPQTDVMRPENDDTELGPMTTNESGLPNLEQPPPEVARRGTDARRNWRRQRIASMHAREYDAQAEEARRADESRPIWRRALGLA